MKFNFHRSTLDSLKGIFNVYRRKPPLGATCRVICNLRNWKETKNPKFGLFLKKWKTPWISFFSDIISFFAKGTL